MAKVGLNTVIENLQSVQVMVVPLWKGFEASSRELKP